VTDRPRNPDCIFCRIVAGEVPSNRVAEDEAIIAFRDIAPRAPTHILIVPRQHIASAGLGFRFSQGTALAFRADWAMVWNEGGNQGSGDTMVHFSLSYVF